MTDSLERPPRRENLHLDTRYLRFNKMASVEQISANHLRNSAGASNTTPYRDGIAIRAALYLLACAVTIAIAPPFVGGQTVPEGSPHDSYSYDQFLTLLQSSENATEDDSTEKGLEGPSPTPIVADTSASTIDDDSNNASLSLADVIASLYRSYPEIALARQQNAVASGELTSAYGAYDTKLGVYSLSEALGFYENYRSGIGVARQTWWGGYLSAGYRIGRGSFQPWYKERETNRGGELKAGFAQPLLQGRAIDAQRVAVFQASIDQQASQPIVQQAILDASRDAAAAYWQWVAIGAVLEAQRELLTIAEKRNEQFEAGVKAGKFAEIDLILNQQLMAERRAKLFETEQKFRGSAFKLSLYLRDDAGKPLVPTDDWLPTQFPAIVAPPPSDFQNDLAGALARRPEPQILQYELRQVQLERQLACNDLLPRFDLVAEASQDVGEAVSDPDDKGEFQIVLGVQSEVPIQRRKARGKIQSTAAKMVQVNEKIRLVQNKIAAELQTANNALMLSTQIVQQSELSLRAAIETLERYRFAFEKGKIDLIYLNLLETKANETEIKLVEAQQGWFAALSGMQIALGLEST